MPMAHVFRHGLFFGFSVVACVGGHASDGIRILEKSPSADTVRAVTEAFRAAHTVVIKYTPLENMGRLGFDRETADSAPKYQYILACHTSCEIEARLLVSSLSHGLLIEGRCPGSFSTVIRPLDSKGELTITISATSGGQCFEMGEKSYFLAPEYSLERPLESLRHVLRGDR